MAALQGAPLVRRTRGLHQAAAQRVRAARAGAHPAGHWPLGAAGAAWARVALAARVPGYAPAAVRATERPCGPRRTTLALEAVDPSLAVSFAEFCLVVLSPLVYVISTHSQEVWLTYCFATKNSLLTSNSWQTTGP